MCRILSKALLCASLIIVAAGVQAQCDVTFSVSPVSSGTTVPVAGTVTYAANQVVAVTGTPAAGYKFKQWDISTSSVSVLNKGLNATNIKIVGTTATTVTAVFEAIQTCALTLVPTPTAGGLPRFATDGTIVRGNWAAATAYTVGQYVRPTTYAGHFYKCTVAGTTGAAQPTWPTTGGTVTDGTVTWQDAALTITYPYTSSPVTLTVVGTQSKGYLFNNLSLASGKGSINQALYRVTLDDTAISVNVNYSVDPKTQATLTEASTPSAALGTPWAASTSYTLNQIVVPTTSNGRCYRCTVAGTSGAAQPTWPVTVGGVALTVVDGGVTWTDLGPQPSSTAFAAVPLWTGNTAFVVGEYVRPTASGIYPLQMYRCVTAGTSAAGEPATWPTDGTTVPDGTVVWQNVGRNPFTVGQTITLSQPAPAGYTFLNWTVTSGSGSIVGNNLTFAGTAVAVQANYKQNTTPTPAAVTIAASPAAGGSPQITDINAWAATTAYGTDNFVRPTTFAGHYYKCTTSGISGAVQPTWPTNGTTVTDGTVVWTDVGLTISGLYYVKDTVNLAPGTATGYTFVGWSLTSGQAAIDQGANQAVLNNAAVTLTANYTANASEVAAAVTLGVSSTTTIPTWAATTAYTANTIVKPTVANSHYYWCTVAGTSAGVEPVWPLTGGIIVDGGVTWLDIGTQPVRFAKTIAPAAWATQTAYAIDTFVKPTTAGVYPNHYYRCTVAGTSTATEPTWPTNGTTVVDNAGLTTWAATTAYVINNRIVPATANGRWYRCTVAGNSGAAAPTWPTTTGSTVADGTATWTDMGTIATWLDVGISPFNVGETFEIIQPMIGGYTFLGWSVDAGSAAIWYDNVLFKYYAKISGATATITANYTATTPTTAATVTLAVSPTTASGCYATYDPVGGNYNARTNLTAYAAGAIKTPAAFAGHYYQCTVAGTTAAAEPVWPTTGGTVADGTVTWKDIGLTIPSTVDSVIPIGYTVGAGYKFVKWQLTTGANSSITYPAGVPANSSINVRDAVVTVTAVFEATPTLVAMTVAISPDIAGQINTLYSGVNQVAQGATTAITAVPNTGYHFVRWDLTGSINVSSLTTAATNYTAYGTSSLTAVFEADHKAVLTMAVDPAAAGKVTSPFEGKASVTAGAVQAITAVPATNYSFSRWNVSGDASIVDPTLASTNATINGDATITAVFVAEDTALLTLATSDVTMGIPTPWLGTLKIAKGTATALGVTAQTGYEFVRWDVSGDVAIDNQTIAGATVRPYGTSTVTAIFKATKTASLTLTVSPANSGKVTAPFQGTASVTASTDTAPSIINITALPNTGYAFVTWQVTSGYADILVAPTSLTIPINVYGDAVVTAVFEATTTAKLTMATSSLTAGSGFYVDGGGNKWSGISSLTTEAWYNISATANTDYKFTKWTMSGSVIVTDQGASATTVYLEGDATLTANFEADPQNITLTIGVEPDGSGVVSPWLGAAKVTNNVAQVIQAYVYNAADYTFAGWKLVSGSATFGNANSNPTTVTPTTDASIVAVFTPITKVNLTLAVSPAGAGTTNPWIGAYKIDAATAQAITAQANDGYTFKYWQVTAGASSLVKIADVHANPTTATLSSDATVTAVFQAIAEVDLTIAVDPANSGITKPWLGTFKADAKVALAISAVPAPGYKFSCWDVTSGAAIVADTLIATTTVTPTGTATITAKFVADADVALTLAVAPAGAGVTTPWIGAKSVKVGEEVAVNVVPNAGYKFVGWSLTSGSASIRNAGNSAVPPPPYPTPIATTTVKVNAAATVTANFVAVTTVKLTLADSPVGAGLFNPHIGENNIPKGEWFAISAYPTNGYSFKQWTTTSGTPTLINSTSVLTYVKLDADAVLTAEFEARTGIALTLLVSPEEAGATKVYGTDNGTIVGMGPDYLIYKSVRYQIEATADAGYAFKNWAVKAGDESKIGVENTNTYRTFVVATDSATVTANFEKTTTAVLTLAVNSQAAGQITTPANSVGTSKNWPISQWTNIVAAEKAGYKFTNWVATPTANASFYRSDEKSTYAMLKGDVTITATFSVVDSAYLTIAVSADGAGYTSPYLGIDKIATKTWTAITATANTGYKFSNWVVTSGSAEIYQAQLAATSVRITADTVITANFVADTTVNINIALSAANAGDVLVPSELFVGKNVATSGTWYKIEVTPSSLYTFNNWEVTSGTASIQSSTLTSTYAMATADSVITAKFTAKTTATLTVLTNPVYAGGSGAMPNLWTGANVVPTGEWIALNVAANRGFSFKNWEVTTGSAIVENPQDATTFVKVAGDATVTAQFTTVAQVQLIIYDPSNNECSEYQINTAEWTLKPAAFAPDWAGRGYRFTGWEVASGTASIDQSTVFNTYFKLTTDARINAKLEKATLAKVTMAVSQPQPVVVAGTAQIYNPTTTAWGAGPLDAIAGQPYEIKAAANAGFKFSSWSVTGQGTLGSSTLDYTYIVPTGDVTVTANYTKVATAKLTMEVSEPPAAGCVTSPVAGASFVPVETVTWITATPAVNTKFVNWTVSGSGTLANANARSTYVTLTGDATVTAVFSAAKTVAMNIVWDPKHAVNAAGTTAEGVQYVEPGVKFQLAQRANTLYTFTAWEVTSGTATIEEVHNGDVTGTSTFYAILTTDAKLTAKFAAVSYVNLTTAVSPDQALAPGRLDPDGSGMNYMPGIRPFPKGVFYDIAPIANTGYKFVSWETSGGAQILTKKKTTDADGDLKDDIDYHVYMTADGSVTAKFEAVTTAQLTVVRSIVAGGNVAGNFNIANDGVYALPTGQKIWVWATPLTGYNFTGWSITGDGNAIKDTAAQYTYLTLAVDGTLTANFAVAEMVKVTYAVSPYGTGATNPVAGTYSSSKGVTYWITATPVDARYAFFKWTTEGGATLGSDTAQSTTVVYSADAKVTATFTQVTAVNLTVAASPDKSAGTFTCANALVVPAVNITEYGTYTLNSGFWMDVTAATPPGSLYRFVRWDYTENIVIVNHNVDTTKIYMKGDGTLTPVFVKDALAELTLAVSPETAPNVPGRPGTLMLDAVSVLPGIVSIKSGVWHSLNASPAFGWKFIGWTSEGDVDVISYDTLWCDVFLAEGKTGKVTANFVEAQTAVLTVTYNSQMGTVSEYSIGEHNVEINSWFTMTAKTYKGYKFTGWTLGGSTIEISGNSLMNELVSARISADAQVTATFAATTQGKVTLACNPVQGGSVSMTYPYAQVPASDTYANGSSWSVDTGKKYSILASPVTGYKFVKWTYSGSVVVTNTFNRISSVWVYGDGSVTAEYTTNPVCELTLAADPPQGLGSFTTDIPSNVVTVPATNASVPGTYTVNVGQTYTVSVSSYWDYHFVKWETTGDITIRTVKGEYGCSYLLDLAGNATATAKFEKSTYATITLATTPDSCTESITAGVGSGVGSHVVYANWWISAEAKPKAGYKFVKWSTTTADKIEIMNENLRITSVYLFGDATLTAEFVAATTAVLTVVYDDPKGGYVSEYTQGTHNVTVGDWLQITAFAHDSYYFEQWVVSGSGAIYQNRCTEEQTFILLTGDTTLTASFKAAAAVNLTLASTPAIGGEATFWQDDATNKIGHGTFPVDASKKYNIEATAYPGYKFSKWTPSDSAVVVIKDVNASTTTFKMTADGTITAEFTALPTGILTLEADPAQALYMYQFDSEFTGGFGLSKDFTTCSQPAWCYFRPGSTTVDANKKYLLQVSSVQSYKFVEWQITGSATIEAVSDYGIWTKPASDSSSSSVFNGWYYLTVTGDATVKAVFEQRTTAMLSVEVTPAASGKLGILASCSEFWDIDAAPVELYTGFPYKVTAFAADGYYFQGIAVIEGNASVSYTIGTDYCFSTMYVTINTDAKIKAIFATTPPTVPLLTMAINLSSAGTITPTAGTYPLHMGQTYAINAVPNTGYYFLYWQTSDKVVTTIGDVNSASTTVALIDDATVTAVFTNKPAITVLTKSFSASLSTDSVGSAKPTDGAKLVANLTSDVDVASLESGIQVGVDGWFTTITAWTKKDSTKGVYFYENASKTVKVNVKFQKDNTWLLDISGSKLALYDMINPADKIQIFALIGEQKYLGVFDPNDSTKWSYKPPKDATKASLLATNFSASYSKIDGISSSKSNVQVGGQNFAKPAGYDNTIKPIVLIDAATWNITATPVVKGDKYSYKSPKSDTSKYELTLDFGKAQKWGFKSTSDAVVGLSRTMVLLPDGTSKGVVNALTFDFGTKADGTVIGQYSWRIGGATTLKNKSGATIADAPVKVATKLNYKLK